MACREYLRSLGLQCKHRRRQRKQMRAASIYNPAAQFVIDMDADDVVERGIAAETERVGSARMRAATLSPAIRRKAAICSATVQQTPGMVRLIRGPSLPASSPAAWIR